MLAATYDLPHLKNSVLNTPMDQFGQWFPHAIEAISTALTTAPQGIPEGWALVPETPTEDMLRVGVGQWLGRGAPAFSAGWQAYVMKTWTVMLAATPTTPAQSSEYARGIEDAAKVAEGNRTDDDSMWDRAAEEIATQIAALATKEVG